MTHDIAQELMATVEKTVADLSRLDETVVTEKPNADVWSIKEILGHLVDSAANNHHRFVRAQHDGGLVFPAYSQDDWVADQDYQTRPWREVLGLWQSYNRHLAHIILRIPTDALDTDCRIGSTAPVTLRFLVDDYLVHLHHHLRQISERTRSATDPGDGSAAPS